MSTPKFLSWETLVQIPQYSLGRRPSPDAFGSVKDESIFQLTALRFVCYNSDKFVRGRDCLSDNVCSQSDFTLSQCVN
jgi:hypothetical protein